jgi:hypothetical protein
LENLEYTQISTTTATTTTTRRKTTPETTTTTTTTMKIQTDNRSGEIEICSKDKN